MSEKNFIEVTSPSTGAALKKIPCDSTQSIEKKIEACHDCYNQQAPSLNIAARIKILEDVVAFMQQDYHELALLIASEGGKPLRDAYVETDRAKFGVKLAISHLMSHGITATPLNTYSSSTRHEMTTTHAAIGPVIAVSAFNHPLNLVTHQIVSAFAAGCPCIIKPAADTPISCIRLVQLFEKAGLPPGWLDFIITEDNALAEKVVTDPRFAFFSFIGSAKVGWYLRSKLPPGTRCALEHGGIAPAFVDESADIHSAVKSLVSGAFYHAGQVCVSTQRIFIEQSVFQDFQEAFCRQVEELVVGNATNYGTQVGPLIRKREVDRIHDWVENAKMLGGNILIGGNPLSNQFYSPTVISNAPANAIINQQEAFGPVCSLMPYTDLDIQIQALNKEDYSFHSAVFSDSNHTIQRIYSGLQTGCLMVNEHTAFRHDAMTFAGLKQSGLGAGGMPKSIHHMQVEKLKITNVL